MKRKTHPKATTVGGRSRGGGRALPVPPRPVPFRPGPGSVQGPAPAPPRPRSRAASPSPSLLSVIGLGRGSRSAREKPAAATESKHCHSGSAACFSSGDFCPPLFWALFSHQGPALPETSFSFLPHTQPLHMKETERDSSLQSAKKPLSTVAVLP